MGAGCLSRMRCLLRFGYVCGLADCLFSHHAELLGDYQPLPPCPNTTSLNTNASSFPVTHHTRRHLSHHHPDLRPKPHSPCLCRSGALPALLEAHRVASSALKHGCTVDNRWTWTWVDSMQVRSCLMCASAGTWCCEPVRRTAAPVTHASHDTHSPHVPS